MQRGISCYASMLNVTAVPRTFKRGMTNTQPGTLPERLQHLVKRAHRSVNAAAKAWGVPQSTLKRIIDGTTGRPDTSTLEKIAGGANVTLTWLLTGAHAAGTQEGAPGYGDGPADELVRWLNLPETRAQLPLPERIKHAYTQGVAQAFDTTGFRVVDAWRDFEITRHPLVRDAEL